MNVIYSTQQLHAHLSTRENIVLVPTMGSLHEGHLSLIRFARQRGECVVVSIFVNRLQFGQGEDFEQYPRTLEADIELLANAGVDVVFAPSDREMYPEPQGYQVLPALSAQILEGIWRPHFFPGMCTVVMKLLSSVQPTTAIFGKKDYQQFVVVRQMCRQFALRTKILPSDTIRDKDGLALSSRNRYLTACERQEAPMLAAQLSSVREAVLEGERDFSRLEQVATDALNFRGWTTDYVSIRRQDDLLPPSAHCRKESLIVLAAARLGSTRLVDTLEI